MSVFINKMLDVVKFDINKVPSLFNKQTREIWLQQFKTLLTKMATEDTVKSI